MRSRNLLHDCMAMSMSTNDEGGNTVNSTNDESENTTKDDFDRICSLFEEAICQALQS